MVTFAASTWLENTFLSSRSSSRTQVIREQVHFIFMFENIMQFVLHLFSVCLFIFTKCIFRVIRIF